ncbi:hypothetical protein HK096_007130 [Nowakowskiella sp. JEL0078]|nr:hypothetical protein HK096_007130 [Nowakowskiella sp. JEL0078]
MSGNQENVPETRYSICFSVQVREFKGNTAAKSLPGIFIVNCNEIDQFKIQILNHCSEYFQKEVKVNADESVEWVESDSNDISIELFNKIIILNDRIGKKQYPPLKLKESALQSWHHKEELSIFVHMYSTSVSNSKKTLQTMETDKTGAAKVRIVEEMQVWAGLILEADRPLHDEMIEEGILPSIVNLFQPTPTNYEVMNCQIRNTSHLVTGETNSTNTELEMIEKRIKGLKRTFDGMIDDLIGEVKTILARKRERLTVLEDFNSAMKLVDIAESLQFDEHVAEQNDIDHM